jgi:hypothetical protein
VDVGDEEMPQFPEELILPPSCVSFNPREILATLTVEEKIMQKTNCAKPSRGLGSF